MRPLAEIEQTQDAALLSANRLESQSRRGETLPAALIRSFHLCSLLVDFRCILFSLFILHIYVNTEYDCRQPFFCDSQNLGRRGGVPELFCCPNCPNHFSKLLLSAPARIVR